MNIFFQKRTSDGVYTYQLGLNHSLNKYSLWIDDDVNCGKEVLYERLNSLGFEVMKSETNFVFFKTPDGLNPIKLMQYLKENRILIRGLFERRPFDNHLRITAGDEDQMNLFCDSIEDYLIVNKNGKKLNGEK